MMPNHRFWKGKQVCVTGGTGFLGYHLVQQLLDLGAHVSIVALPPKAGHPLLAQDRTVNVFGDVRDADLVRRAVAGRDIVFHSAGVVAVSGPALARMHAVHVAGTRHVLEATSPQTRVVHTSSVVTI